MKKFNYKYKGKISGGNGVLEAENMTEAKKQVNEFLKNDPITVENKLKLKDYEITVEEVK